MPSSSNKTSIRSASLTKTTSNPLFSNEMINFKKQNQKQLNEIESVIEKLSKVAMDLSISKPLIPPFLWRKEDSLVDNAELPTATHLGLRNNIVGSKTVQVF